MPKAFRLRRGPGIGEKKKENWEGRGPQGGGREKFGLVPVLPKKTKPVKKRKKT